MRSDNSLCFPVGKRWKICLLKISTREAVKKARAFFTGVFQRKTCANAPREPLASERVAREAVRGSITRKQREGVMRRSNAE